mmetsp:Transcript_8837/g.25454  ORF Transcript_8837/g.25454 Transcript_8837/m.25454 type:complete len:204 (+) Transcript_8837:323-934(+)
MPCHQPRASSILGRAGEGDGYLPPSLSVCLPVWSLPPSTCIDLSVCLSHGASLQLFEQQGRRELHTAPRTPQRVLGVLARETQTHQLLYCTAPLSTCSSSSSSSGGGGGWRGGPSRCTCGAAGGRATGRTTGGVGCAAGLPASLRFSLGGAVPSAECGAADLCLGEEGDGLVADPQDVGLEVDDGLVPTQHVQAKQEIHLVIL